jgi:excisionase family DNA binding protein
MNKELAATYLGITVRTLQRHMSAKKIAFKGGDKSGKQATFMQEELNRFKAEQDSLTNSVSPSVSLSEDVRVARSEQGLSLPVLGALERFAELANDLRSEQLEIAKGMTDAVRGMSEAVRGLADGHPSRPSVTDLAHKLMLSIDESAQLSGVSSNHIREAIKAGKLKAKIVGRGYRIKRPDLDSYIKKL